MPRKPPQNRLLQLSNDLVFLSENALESGPVDKVKGVCLVRKKLQCKTASRCNHLGCLFDGHIGLAKRTHHQVHDKLKPPDLPCFFPNFRFGRHDRFAPNPNSKNRPTAGTTDSRYYKPKGQQVRNTCLWPRPGIQAGSANTSVLRIHRAMHKSHRATEVNRNHHPSVTKDGAS